MYSAQPNGAEGATINPAALSSELGNAPTRGVKRSRSPDYPDPTQQDAAGDDGGSNPRKRGRPMKRPSGTLADVTAAAQAPAVTSLQQQQPIQAPQAAPPPQNVTAVPLPQPGSYAQQPQPQPQPAPQPQSAPPQASPVAKPTPKSTLKALPTMRDHTTDQLGPGNDEYLPREVDDAGEKKVMHNGQLLGGREYRCRTFHVPGRGDKLFMLATECARVLGYRDSYLLFNKNRSLYKIIASQGEKDDLVSQEILPFSYRSRQIAIVTARSMFRQFGARVIVNGRRVRDDYWESKARKQGFTEADLAGEKRPGGTKAREAAQEAAHMPVLTTPQTIIYSSNPAQFGEAPQPQLVQPDLSDNRHRDYSSILKGGPRQEITGPAYQDRTQPSPITEIHAHAHHAAEFNRGVTSQRDIRHDYLRGVWSRPHEQPQGSGLPGVTAGSGDALPPTTTRPPQSPATGLPSGMMSGQSPTLLMTAPPYSQGLHAQGPAIGGQPQIRGAAGGLSQGPPSYNYGPTNQMWPSQGQAGSGPQQQQQAQQQHAGYSSYTTGAQHSPHSQASPTPQLRHSGSSGAGGGVQQSLQFSGIPGMNAGYPSAAGQSLYTDQTPRQYMPPAASGSPAVTQGWPTQQTSSQQWWANPQQ